MTTEELLMVAPRIAVGVVALGILFSAVFLSEETIDQARKEIHAAAERLGQMFATSPRALLIVVGGLLLVHAVFGPGSVAAIFESMG
ncbi:MAG: hypothetical protein AAF533_29380 [Acidobacteriota bacterium]